jgi:transposase InsO family protein
VIETWTLRMAIRKRRPPESSGAGLVHHSERGVQYACHAYRGVLAAHGIAQSMSHARDCYDNAMAESLFATLEKELTHHDTYANQSNDFENGRTVLRTGRKHFRRKPLRRAQSGN